MSALKRVLLSVPGGAGVDGGVLLPRVMMAAFVMNANRALMGPCLRAFALCHCDGFFYSTPASMPGDVLLFQRLSVSTIGAVRFHGRVRDGIGWVTDAMVTKQWRRRAVF